MTALGAILTRELTAAFGAARLYLGFAILLALAAAAAISADGPPNFERAIAAAPYLVAVAAPAWAAWRFGEERARGLAEVMAAAAVPIWANVLGRWIASTVIGLALLATWLPLAVALDATTPLDPGAVFASMVSVWLAACAMSAVAIAAASARRTAFGAWLAGFVACLILTLAGETALDGFGALVFGELWPTLSGLSVTERMRTAGLGVLVGADAAYFLILSATGLALAMFAHAARQERWS